MALTTLVEPGIARRTLFRCRRGCRLALRSAGRGVVDFYNSSNLTFAASIAYYTLLSLFPFVILVLSILTRAAMGHDGSNEALLQQLVGSALPSRFDFVGTQIQTLARTPLHLSVLSTVLTIWASMGVFGAITSAVNHAWGVEKAYGFFQHKLVAFVMLITAGVLAVVALALVSAFQMADSRWFASALTGTSQLSTVGALAWRYAPTPMFVLVVGLIYYYVPNAEVRLKDVWVGAILAGVLWRLAFSAFAWYVRGTSRFGLDGSVSAVMAFLIWVYLSAVIFLYGVGVTAAYARLRKHLPQAAPAAEARS